MNDDNGESFIATLYNIIFSLDLCNQLFSIITLNNSGHTCLFYQYFCTVFFSDNKQNAVTLPHSVQRKRTFLVKTKEKSKLKNQTPRKKISRWLFYHRLGHRSTISLFSVDNEKFGKILNSGWILTLSLHHVISQQSTRILGLR